MNPSAKSLVLLLKSRRILQVPIDTDLPDSGSSPDPIFRPGNGSSGRSPRASSKLVNTSPFDSSMALTILVLLTALFFLGFFSIYIRRFSEEDSSDLRRRRHPSPPGGLHDNHKGGLDSSTINALPLVSYCGGAKQLITGCSICLSEFEEGEIVKLIPHCTHVFHAHCLDTWLASHVSCPLCRGTQFLKVAEAEAEEVRLDVVADENRNGGDDGQQGGRSTADGRNTWRGEGMRRSGSCKSLGDRPAVLQRSMSF